MKNLRALIILACLNVLGQETSVPHSAQRVSVLAIGADGAEFKNCRVEEFLDLGTNEERKERFQGLVGHGVPFGKYVAWVSCDGSTGATSIVSIDRADAFVVVSSARHVADYVPGYEPRFHVRVSNWRELKRPWAQLIGVYDDFRVVGQPLGDFGDMDLPVESPGKYVLTIFDGGRLLCRQPISIENIGGRIVIQARTNCLLQTSSGVRLEESRGIDAK